MPTHHSRGDLWRTLRVLTPSAPLIPRSYQSDAQSSGQFDLGAFYAAELEKVLRGANPVRQPPPPLDVAELMRVLAAAKQPVNSLYIDIDAEDVDVHIVPMARAAMRARPMAFFGLAVTWLATATLGSIVATSVPGHTRQTPVMTAVAADSAPLPEATSPVARTSAPTAVKALAAPPAVALVSAEDLPLVAPPAPAYRTAARKARSQPRYPPAQPPANAPAPGRAPAKEPPRPTTLEEWMRRAVEGDQAKMH